MTMTTLMARAAVTLPTSTPVVITTTTTTM
jgi:hypothetical protein